MPKKVFLSMHVLSPVAGALALVCVSFPALAQDSWTQTTERGLSVLSLAKDGAQLRVVCDPGRVYGPTSNASIIVHLPKDPAPSMIVFLAKSGEQARLTVQNGSAAQAKVKTEDWSTMVAILKAGGEFAVVSSHDSVTFETDALPDLACE